MEKKKHFNFRKSRQALYISSAEDFILELEKADDFDKSNITNENLLGRPQVQRMIDMAIEDAILNKNNDIVLKIVKLGYDITPGLERCAKDIESITKNGSFLGFLLDHWPVSFGPKENEFINIHKIASNSYIEALDAIIDRGFDVNQKDTKGRTPLMYSKNEEIAETLMRAGGDIHMADNEGRSAVWHAVQLFVKKSKRVNGHLTLNLDIARAVKKILGNNHLVEEEKSILLGRQLTKRFNAGLIIGPASRIPAREHWTMKDILIQLDAVEAYENSKKLGSFVKGKSRRKKQEETITTTPIIKF